MLTFWHCEVKVTEYDETGSVEGGDVVDAGGGLVEEDTALPRAVVMVPDVMLRRVNVVAVTGVEGQQLTRDLKQS